MLSHFSALVVFATFASVIFGITQRSTTKTMIRYGLYCWGLFVGSAIVASWLMWFVRR